MAFTDRVKQILSWYGSDNPGTVTQLARLLTTGTLAGTGKLVILPVDQGFEHGPIRSFGPNLDAHDPDYHFRLAIDAALRDRVHAAGAERLVLGVRPEEVLIDSAQPDQEAVVQAREPLGDETIYDLQVGEQMLQTRQPPSLRLQVGTQVPIRLDRNRLRIYDRDTERAII